MPAKNKSPKVVTLKTRKINTSNNISKTKSKSKNNNKSNKKGNKASKGKKKR